MMSSDDSDLPDYFRTTQELRESFASKTEVNIPLLRGIISSHFGCSCGELSFLNEGAYARVYEASLATGQKLAIRVVLPVRDNVKTEAEVATMIFVRAKTTIPVPRVHLFCSTCDNPVGAEWIVMDFVSGERFLDCWDDLPLEAKRRTAEDLASITASLFSFTSTHCGSLVACHSLIDDQRARRFGNPPSLCHTVDVHTSSGDLTLGPVNDFAFIEPLFPAPLDSCAPFASERQFLEVVAYGNIEDKDERVVKLRRWPYEKVLEIYDRVRQDYSKNVESKFGDAALFHFSHGDLSETNILLDKATGRITGVIDWEVSGFAPSWLAAGRGGALEDHTHQGEPGGGEYGREDCFCLYRTFYEDPFPVSWSGQPEQDWELRSYFVEQLLEKDAELAAHQQYGSELRAMFEALRWTVAGNVQMWVEKYHERRWDVSKRGAFPFDLNKWRRDRYDLWKRLHDEGACL